MNGVWCLVVTATLASCVSAQNGRGPPHHDNNRHGWDIRIAVPGNPGNDYPTLSNIPRTSFSCAGRETGYYADFETNCQVFRVCTVGSTYGFQSFLCPNGTLFNQAVYVCDWWMNVNCRESEQLVNIKNEQFQNLRLGPELMKDVKKMLTYPMRNPYDPKSMRNSPIIMQDYKPPAGQLFPNEALLAGPERPPSNVYVPKQNLIQNIQSNNEHYYSATTYQPKYPNQYTTSRPRDTEVFQRQRQTTPKFSARFQEEPNLRSGNSVSNTHAGQFNQYTKSESSNYRNSQPQRPLQDNNYQKNSQYFQKQTIKPTTQAPNIPTTPRKQRGKQRALHIGTRKPTISNEKQITSVTNQKYNQHLTNNYQQDTPQRYNQQITSNYQQETQQKYNQQVNNNNNQETQQKYNHQINNKNQQETQQKYNQQAISNIQRETQPIIPIKNNNLQFLKDIQFDSTLPEEVQNEVKENVALVFSLLADSINAAKEYTNIAQQEVLPATPDTSQFQSINNAELAHITNMISKLTSTQYADIYNQNTNIIPTSQNIPANIQQYQQSVPEVTNQIYNQPYTSSFIQPSNTPQQISSNFIQQNAHQGNFPPNLISPQQQYLHNSNLLPSGNQNNDITNLLNQPPAGVEILQSQTVPFSAAKLQIGSQPTQTFNQETIANLLNGNNGISAHLHDKIIGTIKHPLESDKLVTYEKDQSYFFTSNLNENPSLPNGSGRLLQPTPTTGTRLSNENFPDSLSLQFIPTNGYEVENERQQQQLLNAFQIDEFGAPREIQSNTAQNNNDEQVLTSNIDISIEHPPLARQVQGTNSISALYSGPSSYSAPQASVVGRRIDEPNPYSSKLEDLDENNDNGYPRTRPARQFNY